MSRFSCIRNEKKKVLERNINSDNQGWCDHRGDDSTYFCTAQVPTDKMYQKETSESTLIERKSNYFIKQYATVCNIKSKV